jgi:hypothetical protein
MARSLYTRHRHESPADWAQRLVDGTDALPRETMRRIVRLCVANAIVHGAANDT